MNLITNNFVITVHMTSLKKYSGSAGPYTMRIDGVDRDGQTFVLNPNKFNPSENYRLITKALTVGDLRLIVIKKPEKITEDSPARQSTFKMAQIQAPSNVTTFWINTKIPWSSRSMRPKPTLSQWFLTIIRLLPRTSLFLCNSSEKTARPHFKFSLKMALSRL